MTLYRKVTDEEGNETFEAVEQLPEDMIKETPLYQSLLEESITRRQKLKELRQQLESAAPAPAPEPVVPPSAEDIAILVEQRLLERQQAAEKAKLEEEQRLNKLIEQHELNPNALPILKNARDPEEVALALARSGLTFARPTGGEETPGIAAAVKGALAKLNLE